MKAFTLLALFAAAVAAQVSNEPGSTTCGGETTYSQSDIDNAAEAALNNLASGQAVGYDSYPHQYNDYEGFSLSCGSPYYEFPLEQGSTYSGGSPGADRVVIGSVASDYSSAQYCASITHDGESNNDFQECDDS